MNTGKTLVWDIPTRLFHWLFADSFAVAYITSESESWLGLHLTAGFTFMGLLAFRLVWGFIGSRYARFSAFAFKPAQVIDYIRHIRSQHHLGHNPLGSVGIFLLLGFGAAVVLTGLAMYLSGSELLEEPHEFFANAMLALVMVHIAGVVISGKLHGENLSRAMVTGQKTGNAADGINSQHAIVGALLLAAVLGFWGYAWQHPFDISAFDEEQEKSGQTAADPDKHHEED